MVTQEPDSDSYYHYLREDIVEKEDWRCFHTVNGEHDWSIWHMVPNECTTELVDILMCKRSHLECSAETGLRIFEDVTASKVLFTGKVV
jgi:hypothetical protein